MAKCALLGMVYNEPDFFRMWYEYYSKFFDVADIYVLDDGCYEGQFDGYKCHVDVVHPRDEPGKPRPISDAGDQHVLNVTVKKYDELLKSYEYVLRADTDEFVVPDPVDYPDGLGQFIAELKDDFAQCSGYNVLDNGVPLNLDQQPWMLQRTHYHRDWYFFCKVMIANQSPGWELGFHHSKWQRQATDNFNERLYPYERTNLKLLHLNFACSKILQRRWTARNSTDWRFARTKVAEFIDSRVNHPLFIKEEIPDRFRRAL